MGNSDIRDLPEVPQAGTLANRVYELALHSDFVDAEVCVRELGLTREEAERTVRDLVDLRLLLSAHGCRATYVAVNPLSASLQLLAPYDEQLRSRQNELEQIRQQMHSLLPLYRANLPEEQSGPEIQRIDDLDTVRGVLGQLAEQCRTEVITSQPGGARDVGVLREAARRDREVLDRGVRMRTLYQHTARFDQPTREYVERISEGGAEVRTTTSGFQRAIVYDRSAAVIPLADNSRGALLVRDPDLVHFVAEAFEGSWDTADPFRPTYDRDEIRLVSDTLNRSLLRMLANGHDDKAIARRLGISPRTCQRRISELMHELGARTRLHAGVLIHQRGLLDEPVPVTAG
ncbi:LuxR C-terminal-related transcriptional regulator [Streptomyces uncialis]|uniref:LuxR C-terminal-related transcriptional regulator n=1 Tax=Streptomyces uncialis TaxID=1048205 RepID=UPI00381D138F